MRIISSKLQEQKNIVMSFEPNTEKIKKKQIGICSILGRIRTRIHHPGSGSEDPDPKHCSLLLKKYTCVNNICLFYHNMTLVITKWKYLKITFFKNIQI